MTGTFNLSAVTVLNNKAYVAASGTAWQVDISDPVNPGTPASYNITGDMYGIAAGGGFFYGASTSNLVYKFDEARASAANFPKTLGTGKDTTGEVVLDAQGDVFLGVSDATVKKVLSSTAQISTISPSTFEVPHHLLLGSDGRLYVGQDNGDLHALNLDATVAWKDTLGSAAITAPITMDCAGHLYVPIGGAVQAYITDAKGLLDTPWPKYQRDSRNTGNGDFATKWGVRTGGSCTQ
jgi:hypothetical protein